MIICKNCCRQTPEQYTFCLHCGQYHPVFTKPRIIAGLVIAMLVIYGGIALWIF